MPILLNTLTPPTHTSDILLKRELHREGRVHLNDSTDIGWRRPR